MVDTYTTSKTDWVATDTVNAAAMNRIENNIAGVWDTWGVHYMNDGTLHESLTTKRSDTTTALIIEAPVSNPASPADGRIWVGV